MKWCFITGSSRELSLAELAATLDGKRIPFEIAGIGVDFVELSLPAHCDGRGLMDILGGCIKIGLLLDEYPFRIFSPRALAEHISSFSDRRLTFGISASSVPDVPQKRRMGAQQLKRLGLEMKRELKTFGVASRCVLPQQNTLSLSSVVVEKNGLLKQGGIELLLIQHPNCIRVYTTKAVQPFEAFSSRDYGRPRRSMTIGMLPPKIARMMVNISNAPSLKHAFLLDPFCGTGTILQEAILLGISSVTGGDISDASLKATHANMDWLKKNISYAGGTIIDIQHCDARKLQSCFPSHVFDAIVTETYLGPILQKDAVISLSAIQDIERLISDSFASFKNVLKLGTRIVIAVPCWPSRSGVAFLPTLHEAARKNGFTPITHLLLAPFNLPSLKRDSIVWYREGQRVGREICVFKYTGSPTQNETRTHRHRAQHTPFLQNG